MDKLRLYLCMYMHLYYKSEGLGHLWYIPDQVPSAVQEEVVVTTINPLERQMQEMILTPHNSEL